ncbi:unnamed protein product, partial [Gulo gulo]
PTSPKSVLQSGQKQLEKHRSDGSIALRSGPGTLTLWGLAPDIPIPPGMFWNVLPRPRTSAHDGAPGNLLLPLHLLSSCPWEPSSKVTSGEPLHTRYIPSQPLPRLRTARRHLA